MSRMQPYELWEHEELRELASKHVRRLKVSNNLGQLWINLINEAFDSKYWIPIKDFNGCTIVQDTKHPSMACLCHDYMWISGHGGFVSDRIFYALMIAQGVGKGRAMRRWFLVRSGWYLFFMWKYIFQKKFMKPTKAMIEIDEYFKLIKKLSK
ncbi:MAG: hypothetical protein ACI9N9_000094 [Enterobacterales bacterium]|jgi:hypothetical protein